MKIAETWFENGQMKLCEHNEVLNTDMGGQETTLLNLYPKVKFQTLLGFGGAITESSGAVLNEMPEVERKKIIQSYFSRDGLGYTLARTHIDSCDFSLGNYCADDVPDDTGFSHFSLSRDEKNIIPHLKAAKEAAGDIKLFMAPWSPPAYMKTTGQRNGGGELKPEYYEPWARYIAHYIERYEKNGLSVFCVSVQNEPKAVQTWDSCVYSAAQEKEFVHKHLAQALTDAKLKTAIMIWDHNKERMLERSEAIIDDDTDRLIGAIGFHWYTGDHFEAISLTHSKYPDKLLISSEACVEYSRFAQNDGFTHAYMYAHDIIGGLNNGMHGFIDWNLVLDNVGGPNHVGNYCEAPVMCDVKKGEWRKNTSWYFIGHFSRYILPGARRIGHSIYTGKLETTAYENPDGSISTIILNPHGEERPCTIRVNNRTVSLKIKAQSIITINIRGEELL